MKYAEKMAKSADPVDSRLLNIYRIRKAHQINMQLGFNNPFSTEKSMRVKRSFSSILNKEIVIPLSEREKHRRKSVMTSYGNQS